MGKKTFRGPPLRMPRRKAKQAEPVKLVPNLAADLTRPLKTSQVVPFFDRKCKSCSQGLYVVWVRGQRQAALCACAMRRFNEAHHDHIVKHMGQLYWCQDYVPPGGLPGQKMPEPQVGVPSEPQTTE